MRRSAILLPALIACSLVYCSSPASPRGPVLFGLISGNGQRVTAGADSLLQPVVGQAYRAKNGSVAFRFGPAPLDAQTQIGTGVADILTCSSPVGSAGLVAYVQCAQTDAQGMVTYWYQPGTIATDSACAEIRATPDGEPAVLATTCSVVEPGPLAVLQVGTPSDAYVAAGDTVDLRTLVSGALDQYNNSLPVDSVRAYADSDIGWAWVDRTATVDAPTNPTGSGWITTVPNPAAMGWGVAYDGYYHPGVAIWIRGILQRGAPVVFKVAP